MQLLPDGSNRLGDQIRRIRAALGSEFLHAPTVHFRDVEIALLVDVQSVDAPETTRKHSERAPGRAGRRDVREETTA